MGRSSVGGSSITRKMLKNALLSCSGNWNHSRVGTLRTVGLGHSGESRTTIRTTHVGKTSFSETTGQDYRWVLLYSNTKKKLNLKESENYVHVQACRGVPVNPNSPKTPKFSFAVAKGVGE